MATSTALIISSALLSFYLPEFTNGGDLPILLKNTKIHKEKLGCLFCPQNAPTPSPSASQGSPTGRRSQKFSELSSRKEELSPQVCQELPILCRATPTAENSIPIIEDFDTALEKPLATMKPKKRPSPKETCVWRYIFPWKCHGMEDPEASLICMSKPWLCSAVCSLKPSLCQPPMPTPAPPHSSHVICETKPWLCPEICSIRPWLCPRPPPPAVLHQAQSPLQSRSIGPRTGLVGRSETFCEKYHLEIIFCPPSRPPPPKVAHPVPPPPAPPTTTKPPPTPAPVTTPKPTPIWPPPEYCSKYDEPVRVCTQTVTKSGVYYNYCINGGFGVNSKWKSHCVECVWKSWDLSQIPDECKSKFPEHCRKYYEPLFDCKPQQNLKRNTVYYERCLEKGHGSNSGWKPKCVVSCGWRKYLDSEIPAECKPGYHDSTSTTTKTTTTMAPPPPPPPPPPVPPGPPKPTTRRPLNRCEVIRSDGDPCKCRENNCGYNTYSSSCVDPKPQYCPKDFFEEGECGFHDQNYLRHGVICKFVSQDKRNHGNCEIEDHVFGVNMNGNHVDKDSYGVTLHTESDAPHEDPSHIRVGVNITEVPGKKPFPSDLTQSGQVAGRKSSWIDLGCSLGLFPDSACPKTPNAPTPPAKKSVLPDTEQFIFSRGIDEEHCRKYLSQHTVCTPVDDLSRVYYRNCLKSGYGIYDKWRKYCQECAEKNYEDNDIPDECKSKDSPSSQVPTSDMMCGRDTFTNFHPKDKKVFLTFITGKPPSASVSNKGKCVSFHVPLYEDGNYQLQFMTLEPYETRKGVRSFSISMNGHPVVKELDIRAMEQFCQGVTFTANFKVRDDATQMQIKGEKDFIPMPNKKLIVGFCYSECHVPNPTFIMSGFRVIRVKGQDFDEKLCDGKPCGETCNGAQGNMCYCKHMGCEWNEAFRHCYYVYPGSDSNCSNHWTTGICTRSNVYYANAGQICKRSGQQLHNCEVAEVILAYNFFDKETTDHRGIKYKEVGKGDSIISDPDGLLDVGEPDEEINGLVTKKDAGLYKHFLYAKGGSGQNGKCVSLKIPLPADGDYELSIKTAPTSDAPEYFGIKLGKNYIVHQFSPLLLVGRKNKFKAIDLNLQFSVFDGHIHMPGYEAQSADSEITFSVCHGECDETDNAFQINAISVVRFRSREEYCNYAHGDVCECRRRRCQWNYATETCHSDQYVCSDFWKTGTLCLRKNVFYSQGGIVCQWLKNDTGNCQFQKVVLAVNTGGGEVKDSRGIVHQTWKDVKTIDPDGVAGVNDHGVGPSKILPLSGSDQDAKLHRHCLYGISGVPLDGKPKCISYEIPVEDGQHELNIKTASLHSNRYFSFLLNGYYIVQEFSPADYTKGLKLGMDLSVHFHVVDNAKYLIVPQVGELIPVQDSKIYFSTCYGQGCSQENYWPSFHIHSFSVVRYGSADAFCTRKGHNLCDCKKVNCEYDLLFAECKSNYMGCSKFHPMDYECNRNNTFYMRGGVVCKGELKDNDKCNIKKVIVAINAGNKNYVKTVKGQRGIVYTHGVLEPQELVSEATHRENWTGVPEADKPLYRHCYLAKKRAPANATNDICAYYKITIPEDGVYELSVKTSAIHDHRTFALRFNGIYIVKELRPEVHAGGAKSWLDVSMNFVVRGGVTKLSMNGYENSEIKGGVIKLEFCNGFCVGGDVRFHVQAFSIVLFDTPIPDPIPEVTTTMKTTTTKTTTTTQKPTEPPVVEPPPPPSREKCEKIKFDVCKCRNEKCEFNVVTGKCAAPAGGNKGGCNSFEELWQDECRRENVHYVKGGILCKQINQQRGDCSFEKVIFAVDAGNEGEDRVSGSRGITYDTVESNGLVQYETERNDLVIPQTHSESKWENIPSRDEILYASCLVGKTPEQKTFEEYKCIMYHIYDLNDEGNYELSIKTSDTGARRSFSIIFNDIYLIREFRPEMYSEVHKKWIDISVNFQVLEEGTILRMQGYSDTIIQEGGIPLYFCFGTCEDTDPTIHLHAVSVVSFGPGAGGSMTTTPKPVTPQPTPEPPTDTTVGTTTKRPTSPPSPTLPPIPTPPPSPPSCDKSNGNVCSCRKNSNCEWNQVKATCFSSSDSNKEQICPDSAFGEFESALGNRHYAFGGSLCKNTKPRAGCNTKELVTAVNLGDLILADPGIDGNEYSGVFYWFLDTSLSLSYIRLYDPKNVMREARYNDGHGPTLDGSIVSARQIRYLAQHLRPRANSETHLQCNAETIKGVPENDKRLYLTLVYGDPLKVGDVSSDTCFSFYILIRRNGNYRLTLKFIEPSQIDRLKRMFNVKINNEPILTEFEIRKYAPMCHGLDVIVNFKISEGGTKLSMVGLPDTTIRNLSVPLEFCYSNCGNLDGMHINPVVSGFYLERCRDYDGAYCQKYSGSHNICTCRDKHCDFDLVTNQCQPVTRDGCTSTHDVSKRKKICRRKTAYYAIGGALCAHIEATTDFCKIEKVTFAVNTGSDGNEPKGERFTDSRGITYDPDYEEAFKPADPAGIIERREFTFEETGNWGFVEALDVPLYVTAIESKSQPATGEEKCVTYRFPIDSDGVYELSIKTSAVLMERPISFSIRMNDILIVREVRPRDYVDFTAAHFDNNYHTTGGSHNAMDINVIFSVEAEVGFIVMEGFKKAAIIEEVIPLSICTGLCTGDIDRKFRIHAISVVQLISPPRPPIASTTPLPPTPPMPSTPTPPSVREFCKSKGDNLCQCQDSKECDFNTVDNKCIARGDGCRTYSPKEGECRRKNAYYLAAGIICKHEGPSTGDCDMKQQIQAANCGSDETVLAYNGITFASQKTEGLKLRQLEGVEAHAYTHTNSENDIPGNDPTEPQDKAVYKTCIKPVRKIPANDSYCTKYTIKLPMEDGNYELSIKCGAVNYLNATFSIGFNEIKIVRDFRPQKFIDSFYGGTFRPLVVNLNFYVRDKKLQMRGYPESALPLDASKNNLYSHLSFCTGNCNNKGLDYRYHIFAFSVIRFNYSPPVLPPPPPPITPPISPSPSPPETPDGDKNRCENSKQRGNGPCVCRQFEECDYNLKMSDCQNRKNACNDPTNKAAKYECQRVGVYYAINGLICLRQTVTDSGDCRIKRKVFAVNFGGNQDVVGARGINYDRSYTVPYVRSPGLPEQSVEINQNCHDVSEMPTGVPLNDIELYRSCIQGKVGTVPNTDDRDKCITYSIFINTDGLYEASFKTSYFKDSVKRSFSIKFNNYYWIVREFRPHHLTEGWIDLSWNFRVLNGATRLTVKGYTDTEIIGSKIDVSFCYGTCRDVEQGFILHAFSVVEFGPPEGDPTGTSTDQPPIGEPPTSDRSTTTRGPPTETPGSSTTTQEPSTGTEINTTGEPPTETGGPTTTDQSDSGETTERPTETTPDPDPTDTSTEPPTISPGVICKDYDKRPKECRKKAECEYVCSEKTCRDKGELHQECKSTSKYGCERHCNDIIACNLDGCQYHSDTDTCRPWKIGCDSEDLSKNGCIRKNAFYADGGTVCHNNVGTTEKDPCSLAEVQIAVNIGGERYDNPRNGINYSSGDDATYGDPQDTKRTTQYEKPKVDPSDETLYNTGMYGAPRRNLGNDNCVTYKFSVTRDGAYELAVHTMEPIYDSTGKRLFNVRLNNIAVLPELDVIAVAGEKNVGVEIIVLFHIYNGLTRLEINGFKESYELMSPDMELSFCYSNSEKVKDPTYVVNSFHVARFPDVKEGDCSLYQSACDCREAGCEYNVANNKCVSGGRGCPVQNECDETRTCRRANAFYINNGVVCKNEKDSGVCAIKEATTAYNLNGHQTSDKRGIRYNDDISVCDGRNGCSDPDNIRVGVTVNSKLCTSGDNLMLKGPPLSNSEKQLYSKLIANGYGRTQIRDDKKCVTYNIQLGEVGEYELVIKTMEFIHSQPGQRRFDIRLGGEIILKEFDILQYVSSCTPMEIIVNFFYEEVMGIPTIQTEAFEKSIPVWDGVTELSFCFGSCIVKDTSFLAAAFYVANFDVKKEDGKCSAFDDSVCECKLAGCEYDQYRRLCIAGKQQCTACHLPQDGYCRRGDAYFASAGVLCKNPLKVDTGNCEIEKQISAINFASKDRGEGIFTDSRGVVYEPDNYSICDYPNPEHYRYNTYAKVEGVLDEDLDLYAHFASGLTQPKKYGNCMKCNIKLTQDGHYELSVKTGELTLHPHDHTHLFNIKFNGKYVVEGVDVLYLTRSTAMVMEINLIFKVTDGVTRLDLPGYETVEISDHAIHLEFCISTCDKLKNNEWHAVAYYVVKLKDLM